MKYYEAKGFTLVEVIVSMLIFIMGITAVTTMLMTASSIQSDAYKLTRESNMSYNAAIAGKYSERKENNTPIEIKFDQITIELEGQYEDYKEEIDFNKYSYFNTKNVEIK